MEESRRLVYGAHSSSSSGLSVANHGAIVQRGMKQMNNTTNGGSSANVPPALTVEGNGASSYAEVRAAAATTVATVTCLVLECERGWLFRLLALASRHRMNSTNTREEMIFVLPLFG